MPKRYLHGGMGRHRLLLRASFCLIVIIAALVNVTLLNHQPANAQGSRSGTLRVGWTPPIKLDPAFFADAPDASIGMAVYDRLFVTDQEGKLVPSLATGSTVSDDGK